MQTVSQTEPRTEPRVIPASDAAAQFQRILGEVESGQTVLVTRDGMAVAQIGPVAEAVQARRERIQRAFQGIEELRKRVGKLTVEEILSARDEGRR